MRPQHSNFRTGGVKCPRVNICVLESVCNSHVHETLRIQSSLTLTHASRHTEKIHEISGLLFEISMKMSFFVVRVFHSIDGGMGWSDGIMYTRIESLTILIRRNGHHVRKYGGCECPNDTHVHYIVGKIPVWYSAYLGGTFLLDCSVRSGCNNTE